MAPLHEAGLAFGGVALFGLSVMGGRAWTRRRAARGPKPADVAMAKKIFGDDLARHLADRARALSSDGPLDVTARPALRTQAAPRKDPAGSSGDSGSSGVRD